MMKVSKLGISECPRHLKKKSVLVDICDPCNSLKWVKVLGESLGQVPKFV